MTVTSIFRQKPPKPGEVWQLAPHRLPWVAGEEGEPFRPWAVFCRNTRTGRLTFSGALLEAPESAAFRDAVVEAAREWRVRPVRVEVTDPRLAADLRELLAAEGIPVEVRDGFPELEEAFSRMTADLRENAPDGLLSVPGVTVKRVAAFVDAAVRFAAAAPWRHLNGDDTVCIESPEVSPDLRCCRIFGPHRGLGLMFLPEIDAEEDDEEELSAEDRMEDGFWSVAFSGPGGVPPDDLDLWEEQRLPRAAGLYPVALRIGDDDWERPDAGLLAFFEGVLRALAATDEDEMDAGRWKKKVATADGTLRLVLSLPDLLAPAPVDPAHLPPHVQRLRGEQAMADLHRALAGREFASTEEINAFLAAQQLGGGIPHHAPETPAERARDLVYDAQEAVGRRQIVLARQALQIWPDCADAWVILAQRAPDPQTKRERYAQGVAAGERALGPAVFAEDAGHFWGILETRPYMRARIGLALRLWADGEREAAIAHYNELLRLNPNDNQGIRHLLAHALLIVRRHDELAALFASYPHDVLAEWVYARALLAFRVEGDSPAARHQLAIALKTNRHVPKYLLGRLPIPDDLPDAVRLGGDDEAAEYVLDCSDVWDKTPGALDWLRVRSVGLAVAGGPGRPGRKKPKKKKRR